MVDGVAEFFGGLTFRIAHGDERSAALRLRQEIYEAELNHHGLDTFDAQACQLVAVNSCGVVVAVTRIILPDQRPFELEDYVDLAKFLPGRDRIAQIGGLAIRKDHRTFKKNSAVSVGLLKLALMLGADRRISDFILWAMPYLRNFYRSAFFDDLTGPVSHPVWGDLWVMHLDLIDFVSRVPTSPLTRLLMSPHDAGQFSLE